MQILLMLGEESHAIKPQRLSEISTYSSRGQSQNVQVEGAFKVDRRAPIDVWKDLYVRNWLNLHPVETRRKPRVELPRDSTLIVGAEDFTLYYRNRILSRRRPDEIPVKFHTRLTCLTHSHRLPDSLRPRGLEDCLSQSELEVVEF